MDSMEDLPDDFAIALGRVLYLGGLVEMLLDRCLVPAGGRSPRRGLSGARLVKELRKVAPRGTCCASFSMTMMASLGLATIRM
jgi:hypothetical protein